MKRNFISAGAVAALVVMGMALSPAPVLATPSFIFNINTPTGGAISYGGGNAPLVGGGVTVDFVTAIPGAPFPCVSCTLNFRTGNLTGTTAATWTFGSGGFINIRGGVPLAGIPTGSLLLTGLFTGKTTVTDVGASLKISGGAFSDTKPALAPFYGFPPGQQFHGALGLTFLSGSSPPSGFTSRPGNSINGTAANNPVPEPSSLLLLGSGLLGLAAYGRKKIKNMMNS